MYFDVASVVANNDFTLSLVFEDGKSGIYDMKPLIGKGPWARRPCCSPAP